MTTAAASWLRNHDFADVAIVLLVEGYDLAYCTHSDVSGLASAWSSATGAQWTNFKGGLEISGAFTQELRVFNAQVNPSSITLTIDDIDDTLIGLLFADASTAANTVHLGASIDCDDQIITGVESLSAFSAGPELYIGTEELSASKLSTTDGYGNSSSYFYTTGGVSTIGRGVRSLYGTSRNSAFGRPHKVDTQTNDRPIISDRPLTWINRNVGLYLCHRVDGVWSAGLPGSSTNDAELLWTGQIKSFADDGAGRITVECIDVLDRLKTTIGSNLLSGSLQEGFYLTDYDCEMKTVIQTHDTVTGTTTSYDTSVTSFSGSGTVATHAEIASAINSVLGLRLIASSGTYGPANSYLAMNLNQDGKYQLRFTWPTVPANTLVYCALYLTEWIAAFLGFDVSGVSSISSGTINNSYLRPLIVADRDAITYSIQITAANPPLRFINVARESNPSRIAAADTTDGTSFIVQDRIPSFAASDTDGFLLIGGVRLFGVSQNTDGTFTLLNDLTKLIRPDAPISAEADGIFITTAEGEGSGPISLTQVWIDDGAIGELVLRLLASTGTSGYNHPTYDVYPASMSAGIPWQLLDSQSIIGMGTDKAVLMIVQPTPLLQRLESFLNFGARNLVFKNGKLTVVTFGEAGVGEATLVALTEANKAKSVRDDAWSPVLERTTCDRNPDGIINRATLRYQCDLTGKFLRTITVNAVGSQSDTGQIRSITMDGYGIYEDLTLLPGGSTITWQQNVAANALAYFSKPIAIAERSYDFSLATQLYPGTRVTVTDNALVDPTTGTRGVSGLLAWVVATSFDWATGVGKVRFVFQPSRASTSGTARMGLWSPSAMVDPDYGASSGGVVSGLTVDASTVALYKFNETVAQGGTNYTTIVDSGGRGYNLAEQGTTAGNTNNLSHIVNGPNGSRYARWFPGVGTGAPGGTGTHFYCAGDDTIRNLFRVLPYSIEAWINVTDTGATHKLFNLTSGQAGDAAGLTAKLHLLQLDVKDAGSDGYLSCFWEYNARGTTVTCDATSAVITYGTWHHIALTVDAGATNTVRFYVDGVMKQSFTGLTPPNHGETADIYLSYQTDTASAAFMGAMKDFRISSKVRSDDEIAADAASTTYQHTDDIYTFLLWRMNEVPDAIEESTYGYHLRRVAGSYTIASPLAPDNGEARATGTTAYYLGHSGYETLRSALTGDNTVELWTKMDSGYTSSQRGFWCYSGDHGVDTQPTNIYGLDVLTSNKLQVFWEHGAGVNSIASTASAYYSSASDGQAAHHVAITKYLSGGTYKIDAYKDGRFVETVSNGASNFDGGTTAWLQVCSGTAASPNPMDGTIDDLRFSSVVRTSAEILADDNGSGSGFTGGYNATTKQLRLLPHQYSPTADPYDLSNFTIGDKVHVVELSPTTASAPQEWSDTIAAIDLQNSIATLTTGLSGFDATKRYVLEFDAITLDNSSQYTGHDFIADATTKSTGLASNDAYFWTGEPEVTPEEVFTFTDRYRKVNTLSDDTGTAASVHKFADVSRFANTALIYHTAPVLVNQPLTQAVTYTGSSHRIVFGPVYVPLYWGTSRSLQVQLLVANTGAAASVNFRAICTAYLPRGNGSTDFDESVYVDFRTYTLNWTSFSTSSASYEWVTGTIIQPSALPGFPAGCWFVVDANASAGGTAAIKHVMLSELAATIATTDTRQATDFLPGGTHPGAIANANARHRRKVPAWYATLRRSRVFT